MLKHVGIAALLLAAVGLCATATTVTLVAGQEYDAGWVRAVADLDSLKVTIQADNGWVLMETHVYVGTTPPTKSAPGRFPYKHEGLGGAMSDSYEISLDAFDVECGDTLYVAVHAVVLGEENEYGEETAWGEGNFIRNKKNWAMYFEVPVDCGTK